MEAKYKPMQKILSCSTVISSLNFIFRMTGITALKHATVPVEKKKKPKNTTFRAEDENEAPAYKELHIMWEVLGSKAQILQYGMKHLQNKQKNKR